MFLYPLPDNISIPVVEIRAALAMLADTLWLALNTLPYIKLTEIVSIKANIDRNRPSKKKKTFVAFVTC